MILLILASMVGGGILLWAKTQEVSLIQLPGIKKPEKPPQIEPKSAVIYSPEEIWKNRVSLENKQVTVEGIVGSSVDCTKGPPPNTAVVFLNFNLFSHSISEEKKGFEDKNRV